MFHREGAGLQSAVVVYDTILQVLSGVQPVIGKDLLLDRTHMAPGRLC